MQLSEQIKTGDLKSLARAITIIENDLEGCDELLFSLKDHHKNNIIGITGPPGAGKSTLINALVKELAGAGKKIAVVAVDPTSPFNFGSLLADRLRMTELFNNENVFIRSLATRGSLGGLSEKIIEVTDVLKSAGFDFIFVETVGVGQSEVEVAGLADTTVVVFVPEAGDEIQTMKSGIMEIADIFVVNKCDREGADLFVGNLEKMVHAQKEREWKIPVLKTSASQGLGIAALVEKVIEHQSSSLSQEKKIFLLTEKAYRLIQKLKMKTVDKKKLQDEIFAALGQQNFNLYRFAGLYAG